MDSTIEIIKKRLPRNSQRAIAAKCGVSQATVSLTLSGKKKNLQVIEEALSVIEEYEARLSAINERATGVKKDTAERGR